MRSFKLILFFILGLLAFTSEAKKSWLSPVTGYKKNDAKNGYAGIIGRAITGLTVSGGTPYRVHIKGGKWLPAVTGNNINNFENGYAGTKNGNVIDAVAIKGVKEYAAHIVGGGWLPVVTGYNINDAKNGYAGVIGKPIDAIMIKGRKYRVSINTTGSTSNNNNNNTGNTNANTKQGKFIEQLAKYAKKEASNRKKNGQHWSLPSVAIAQAALETGWGSSSLMTKAHAYYGIKAGSNWTGKVYSSKTQECYDGVNMTTITDTFRAYDSVEESVRDYFDLICKTERYKNARDKKDARTCITAIKNAGYATDPNYINNVMSIINSYNLTKYDSVVTK